VRCRPEKHESRRSDGASHERQSTVIADDCSGTGHHLCCLSQRQPVDKQASVGGKRATWQIIPSTDHGNIVEALRQLREKGPPLGCHFAGLAAGREDNGTDAYRQILAGANRELAKRLCTAWIAEPVCEFQVVGLLAGGKERVGWAMYGISAVGVQVPETRPVERRHSRNHQAVTVDGLGCSPGLRSVNDAPALKQLDGLWIVCIEAHIHAEPELVEGD
jgi:hypothetical protein